MKVKVSSIFNINSSRVFEKVLQPSLLLEIVKPILKFIPISPSVLPQTWEVNKEYNLKLYFFNIIPLGKHTIKIINIDKNSIISNETGNIAKVWNHTIIIEAYKNSKTRYTDIIEIKAGLLTIFVWVFAHIFYKHRQRKWKKIIKE